MDLVPAYLSLLAKRARHAVFAGNIERGDRVVATLSGIGNGDAALSVDYR